MRLHLIEPLGFRLEDKELKRAGRDYRDWAEVRVQKTLEAFVAAVNPPRMFAVTTRAGRLYTADRYRTNDALLFGHETRGMPQRRCSTGCPMNRNCACRCRPAAAASISRTPRGASWVSGAWCSTTRG